MKSFRKMEQIEKLFIKNVNEFKFGGNSTKIRKFLERLSQTTRI